MSNEDAHNEFTKFQRNTSFKSWSTSEDRKGGDGTPAMFVDMASPAYRPSTGVPAAKVDAFVDMIELCSKGARGVRGNGRGNGQKWSNLGHHLLKMDHRGSLNGSPPARKCTKYVVYTQTASVSVIKKTD